MSTSSHPASASNLVEIVQTIVTKKIGDTEISNEARTILENDTMNMLQTAINTKIVSLLNEEQLLQFDRLIEQGDDAQTQSFIGTALPDLESIITEEIKSFIESYNTL